MFTICIMHIGGDSIYGAPFADEFHSRLRFNRRGLLGMANAGPNDNGSQFFFTLAPTPELQKKNTLFGTVVGDSLFSALKLGEGEVDRLTERPAYPKMIKRARVLDNPFTDIVPRVKTLPTTRDELLQSSVKGGKKKVKAVKNKKLLSFADDDGDDDIVHSVSVNDTSLARKSKMMSSHDLLKSDPMLSQETADVPQTALSTGMSDVQTQSKQSASPKMHAQVHLPPESEEEQEKDAETTARPQKDDVQTAIMSIENDIKELVARDTKRKMNKDQPSEERNGDSTTKKTKTKGSALSELLSQYKKDGASGSSKRAKGSKREDEIFARLGSFQSKIRKTKELGVQDSSDAQGSASADRQESGPCSLHQVEDCKTCRRSELDQYRTLGGSLKSTGDSSWLSHTLKFSNNKEKRPASEYAPRVEDYVVIDPREREQKALKRR
ncbi:Peptidyl-prolyl isomerase cwc27 [Coemansia sp. Benny D115]|nr:Peptidyl-prolyl isomerase cwc27 [Coemansia sp. Benny D115]